MRDEDARAKEGRGASQGHSAGGAGAPYVALAVLALLTWAVAVVWALRAASEAEPAVGEPLGVRIDLNSADAEALRALRGIGHVLSRRIVEERERAGGFESPDDLLRVRGVTSELVERLRPLVCVGEPSGREGVSGSETR